MSGTDRKGGEHRVVLRATVPPEYPSHLPPACTVLEGIDDEAERAHVQDRLALHYFDEFAGSMVLPQWVEWVRDKWIAKQSP